MAAKQTTAGLIQRQRIGVRAWPIWKLPGWLLAFIIAVVLADAVVLALAASAVRFRAHDLALFAGLLACSAATVELTRRATPWPGC